MKTAPKRYIPKHLSEKDKITQSQGIINSQKSYKKGKYVMRKKKLILTFTFLSIVNNG